MQILLTNEKKGITTAFQLIRPALIITFFFLSLVNFLCIYIWLPSNHCRCSKTVKNSSNIFHIFNYVSSTYSLEFLSQDLPSSCFNLDNCSLDLYYSVILGFSFIALLGWFCPFPGSHVFLFLALLPRFASAPPLLIS